MVLQSHLHTHVNHSQAPWGKLSNKYGSAGGLGLRVAVGISKGANGSSNAENSGMLIGWKGPVTTLQPSDSVRF